MQANGFWDRMTREAMDELASGDKGWREAHPNTLIMAAFGLLSAHLSKKLARPLWLFASSVFGAAVAYVINLILSA